MTTSENIEKTTKKPRKPRKPRKSSTKTTKSKSPKTTKRVKKSDVTVKVKPNPWVINNYQQHVYILFKAAMDEKKKLKKEKKFKENKNKKLRYKLVNNEFEKAKKTDKDKIVNVYYD